MSHCSSLYESELWQIDFMCKKYIKSISVAYHNAIKKICNVRISESNHYLCGNLGILTFEHFLNKKCINFMDSIFRSDSICFIPFKCYFRNFSIYISKLKSRFACIYNIGNLLDNDSDAIMSRIFFVQAREESSIPLYLRWCPDNE